MAHKSKIKILFIGAEASGKTSILVRAIDNRFNPRQPATYTITKRTHDNPATDSSLTIDELAGKSRDSATKALYYFQQPIFVYCVDLSVPLDNTAIINEIALIRQKSSDAHIILVGTKHDRAIKGSVEALKSIGSTQHCSKTLITSAATGENIDFLFRELHQLGASTVRESIESSMQLVLDKVVVGSPLYTPLYNLKGLISNLPEARGVAIVTSADKLVEALRNPEKTVDEKKAAILTFQQECNSHLQGSSSLFKNSAKAVAIVAATAFVTLIAAMVGFGIGFAAGLWTGPGAFISGVMSGSAAAGAVVAVSGAFGVGAGALGGYSLFKPKSAPEVVAVTCAAETLLSAH